MTDSAGVHRSFTTVRYSLVVAIAWLGTPEAHDAVQVGGKAASLSRLAAEHRVPPGFAIPAGRSRRCRARARARRRAGDAARRGRRGLRPPRASGASRSAPPPSTRTARPIPSPASTRRSSTSRASTRSPSAIVRCFASAFTERALDYRAPGRARRPRTIGLAILVQEQVAADSAAVVFSANPVTGAVDEIVINASYGLGESIVGGTTTPDTFVVAKDGLEILERTIGEKRLMTVPVPGGTRELETPALLRGLPSVDDGQIVALASLALSLETAGGAPVDIECAIRDGAVYLLQSRPITTLRSAAGAERGDP